MYQILNSLADTVTSGPSYCIIPMLTTAKKAPNEQFWVILMTSGLGYGKSSQATNDRKLANSR